MEEEQISIGLISFVEGRVLRALINADRKAYLMNRLVYTQDINEVKTIWKEAEGCQPIMGLEIYPQGQGSEMREAIQNRADRDDFYERRKNK
jgi:hypothetical protein